MIKAFSWKDIVLAAAIFILAIATGYQMAQFIDPSTVRRELGDITSGLRNLPTFALFIVLFLNNAIKAFFVLLMGLGLGFVPVFFTLINGVLIGVVIHLAGPSAALLAGILPHGVIEIPAVLFAAAMGMHLGAGIWCKARGKDFNVPAQVTAAVRIYLRFVAPALLVAAFIEAYITPSVMRLVAG